MLRSALLGLSILFLTFISCGDTEKTEGSSTESPSANGTLTDDPSTDDSTTTIHPDLVGVAKAEVDLEKAFPALVEKARAELTALSGLDLTDLEFKLSDEDELLETLVANLSNQAFDTEDYQDPESLRSMSRGMIGIYSMAEGAVLIALDNYQWLTDAIEMPESYNEDILFAVIAHEGGHAIADRKYGLVKLIKTCATPSELIAANAVIEGYAQLLARQVCAKTGTESGINGLTELITTVPEVEDPGQKMLIAVMVQQFSFSYVEGETFLNALNKAKGEEGLAQAFAEPPISRNYVTHPDWYLDPSLRPGSDYQVDVALDVFDERFAELELVKQRIDFDEGLLRTAASALPPEDLDNYADAVIQSRLTLGQSGQSLIVCALHHCQDEDHAVLYVNLSKKLLAAKEKLMANSATPITESIMSDIEQVGFAGFKIKQTIEVEGDPIKTQTVQIIKDDLVCEITVMEVDISQEDLVALGMAVLNKATQDPED